MTTGMSPLVRPWRRWISLLLALALGLSSVEIAWAEAFDSVEGTACISGGDESQDPTCASEEVPTPDEDEDCPCLCACACTSAQRAISSISVILLTVDLTTSPPTLERARAPRTVTPTPQFRPPVA